MSRHVEKYVAELFEHGIEGYDVTKKAPHPSKGVTNPGGAKAFFHPTWKIGKSPVDILQPDLKKVLMELPILLGTLNRIQLDEAGNPVRVPGTNGYNRTHTGLLVYPVNDSNPAIALQFKKRIIEAVQQGSGIDISDSIEVGGVLEKTTDISCLKELQKMNHLRELEPVDPRCCIILSLPSGPPGGSQFWTYQNRKVAGGRAGMAEASTDVNDGELPI